MSLSAFGRLLYIGLWTEAYDDGVFEWKPLTLKARIFPVDAIDVSELLDELETTGVLKRFETDGRRYGVLRNFRKFQRPKKPNSSDVLPAEFMKFVGINDTSSEPVRNQFGTSSEKSPQMEDGGGRGEGRGSSEPNGSSELLSEKVPTPTKKTRKSSRVAYPKDFEEFWTAYPTDSLMSKKEAGAAWKRLSPEDREKAAKAVPAFRSHCTSNPDYRPLHAVRFLSQRRFDGFADVVEKMQAMVFVEAGTLEWSQAAKHHEKKHGRMPQPREHHGKRGWWFPRDWTNNLAELPRKPDD